AVNNQGRRTIGGHVVNRRNVAANSQNPVLVGDGNKALCFLVEIMEIKSCPVAGQKASTECDLALRAIVEKIGGREETGNGLNLAGGTIDRVLGRWIPFLAGRTDHER